MIANHVRLPQCGNAVVTLPCCWTGMPDPSIEAPCCYHWCHEPASLPPKLLAPGTRASSRPPLGTAGQRQGNKLEHSLVSQACIWTGFVGTHAVSACQEQ